MLNGDTTAVAGGRMAGEAKLAGNMIWQMYLDYGWVDGMQAHASIKVHCNHQKTEKANNL